MDVPEWLQSEGVEWAGWMRKRGALNTAYRRRFFVLYRRGQLVYYKPDKDFQLEESGGWKLELDLVIRGQIELNEVDDVVTPDGSRTEGAVLVTPSRKWRLAAKSAEEIKAFVAALNRVIQIVKEGDVARSDSVDLYIDALLDARAGGADGGAATGKDGSSPSHKAGDAASADGKRGMDAGAGDGRAGAPVGDDGAAATERVAMSPAIIQVSPVGISTVIRPSVPMPGRVLGGSDSPDGSRAEGGGAGGSGAASAGGKDDDDSGDSDDEDGDRFITAEGGKKDWGRELRMLAELEACEALLAGMDTSWRHEVAVGKAIKKKRTLVCVGHSELQLVGKNGKVEQSIPFAQLVSVGLRSIDTLKLVYMEDDGRAGAAEEKEADGGGGGGGGGGAGAGAEGEQAGSAAAPSEAPAAPAAASSTTASVKRDGQASGGDGGHAGSGGDGGGGEGSGSEEESKEAGEDRAPLAVEGLTLEDLTRSTPKKLRITSKAAVDILQSISSIYSATRMMLRLRSQFDVAATREIQRQLLEVDRWAELAGAAKRAMRSSTVGSGGMTSATSIRSAMSATMRDQLKSAASTMSLALKKRLTAAIDRLVFTPDSDAERSIKYFVDNFGKLVEKDPQVGHAVQVFIARLTTYLLKNEAASLDSIVADVQEEAVVIDFDLEVELHRGVARAVTSKLRRRLTKVLQAETKEADALFAENLHLLKLKRVGPEFFLVADDLRDRVDYDGAATVLQELQLSTDPVEMVEALIRSADAIFQSYADGGKSGLPIREVGADDYLPIHMAVLLRSAVETPLFAISWIRALAAASDLMGQAGYYLTVLESAVEYISELDLEEERAAYRAEMIERSLMASFGEV